MDAQRILKQLLSIHVCAAAAAAVNTSTLKMKKDERDDDERMKSGGNGWICSTHLVVLLLCFVASEVHSDGLLFTTDYGDDGNDCRTLGTSCRTLTRTMTAARTGDAVYLHRRQQDVAWLCHEDPIQIRVSVSLIGYDDMTSFGCPPTGSRLLMMTANASGNDVISFRLQRVVASGILFVVSGVNVGISESVLTGVTWKSSGVIGLEMKDSVLEDRTGKMTFDVVARKINFRLENVTIARVRMNVTAGFGNFVVRNSTFTGIPDLATFHGGLLLTVTNGTEGTSYIRIEDTIFERQINDDPIEGIMNFHDSALKVITEKTIYFYNPNVSLLIASCTFRDNERGLTIMGPFSSVVIHDSKFLDNIAMHAGAGSLLWTDKATATVRIERCVFERNAAGAFREESIRDHAVSFKIGLNDVTIHTECCKGVISPVGKGGAIRVHRGNVILVDSSFRQNTARQLGGAIYVDINGSLTNDGAYFESSHLSMQRPLEGDIIYSNGFLAIRNTKLNVTAASSHVSILCHSGTVWSIEVVSIEITCPVGYRLRITNSSAYKVDQDGLLKSYKLDQLSYFCESCPRNKYSLDFGYLNYSLRYKDNAYFTLLVNGKYPTPAYSGSYDYHDIECQQCPYGGKCLQEISAVPNFWGYVTALHQVHFQRCQKGYCCSSENCTGFNTCKKNRIGVLCGECEPGYSEAMFTADCVLNSTCDPTIGWPVMLSSAILYFIFLLFQKDMRDLMFSQIVRTAKPRVDARSRAGERVVSSANKMKDVDSSRILQSELELLRSEEETQVVSDLLVNTDDGCKDGEVLDKPVEMEVPLKATSASSQPRATPSDMGVSFLIIIFFYFQDAQLLHIKTVFTSVENPATAMFRDFLSGLFKFRVEVFQFMHHFCFLENMTPVKKLMVRVGLVPCVLAQFGLVYLVYLWFLRVRFTPRPDPTRQAPEGGSGVTAAASAPGSQRFSVKMATGFVLALLFTYQKLATSSFTLLNCVSVNSDTVLFVQGTITCYQTWQYGVIAYAATCIVPFCLVLLIGPGLLKDDLIRLSEFFVACLIPLPFLVRWSWIRFRLYGRRATEPKTLTAECRAVIQIVQGPFKDFDIAFFGPICGQGFLIGRRLILVLLYTFVNDTLIRMLCIMLLCFIILLHHVHVLPYKDKRGNAAGSVSAASLVIVAAINLVRAGFEAAEYVPQGPNLQLMKILDEVENCLMLWFPGVVMGFVILTLLVKLGFLVAQDALEICRALGKSSPSHHNNHAALQASIQSSQKIIPHSKSNLDGHSDRNDIHVKLADV